ncbi:MAG TPA: hypothetical protein DCM87_07435 [Planctomycetes bacterium]|nr:hypothetical protein [Planctomycetota bacterium]
MAAARAVLDLLRIGLLPTAWADVAAGACLAGGAEPPELGGALLLSSGLYLFGMASNAVVDRAEDAVRYPARPVPSGRISLGAARAAAAACALAALAALPLVAPAGRATAAVLFAAILAYNLGGKRRAAIGPALMGACRGLNLLAGALAAAPDARVDAHLLVPALALAAYTAAVTAVSALEGAGASRRRLAARFGVLLAVPLALTPCAGAAAAFPLVALAALVIVSYPRGGFAAGAPNETPVHRLLGGIYLLDAAFAGYAGAPWVCAALTAAGILHALRVRHARA